MNRLEPSDLRRALSGAVFIRAFNHTDQGMTGAVPDDRFQWRCVDTIGEGKQDELSAVFALANSSRAIVEKFLKSDREAKGDPLAKMQQEFEHTLELEQALPELSWQNTISARSGWSVKITALGVQTSHHGSEGQNVGAFISHAGHSFASQAQNGVVLIDALESAYTRLQNAQGWSDDERDEQLQKGVDEARTINKRENPPTAFATSENPSGI